MAVVIIRKHPTQARVRELLDYDPASDQFTWKQSKGGAKAGSVAGCANGSYNSHVIRIDGRSYAASRIKALWLTGEWLPRQFVPEGRAGYTYENAISGTKVFVGAYKKKAKWAELKSAKATSGSVQSIAQDIAVETTNG
jgi:hypothetical protein